MGNIRQSGKPTGMEIAEEKAKDMTAPLESNILPGERIKKFSNTGFSRMRTEPKPDEKLVYLKAQKVAEDMLLQEFPDAYRILNRVYEIVRTPKIDSKTGEIFQDSNGWTVWEQDAYGDYIEDWSKFTPRERDNVLFSISLKLFDWSQRSTDAWGHAMLAKGQWQEQFSIGFDIPMTGTIQDREASATVRSIDEYFYAIFSTIYSRKCESLVRTFERIQETLQKTLIAGR